MPNEPTAQSLLDRVAELEAELDVAVLLVEALVDEDDCWFDHHGGCQAHGFLSLEPGEKCPHAEAKELLVRYDATSEQFGEASG
jgi:hypothetical protein